MKSSWGICVVAICGLWGCTTAGPDRSRPITTDPDDPAAQTGAVWLAPEEAPAVAVAVQRVVAPSPEMLKAALANDPIAMRDAATTNGVCEASSTCPPEFGACTNWSASTLCDSTCGPGQCFCHPVRFCEGDPPEPRGLDSYNAFRVCFDAAQNACTEWSKTSFTTCGC